MIRIGLIGYDEKTEAYIQALKKLDGFAFNGIFTTENVDVNALITKYNIKQYENFGEIVNSCDALILSAHAHNQFSYAVEAIKNYVHVFIDNFASFTADEAFKLFRLSEETKLKFQINHVDRFHPAYQAAKPFFDNPLFIEAHRLTQFNPLLTDVSVVIEQMLLDIDILLSTVKSNVKKISASGVAIVSNTFDIANARIEFDNGCVGNLTASRISINSLKKCRIFQKNAYLTVDFLNNKTDIFRIKQENEQVIAPSFSIGNGKEVIIETPQVTLSDIMELELLSFRSSIINNTQPPVTIEDGYYTLSVAEKILEKMKLTSNCV